MDQLGIDKIHILTVAKVASATFLPLGKKTGKPVKHGHSLQTLKNIIEKQKNTLIITGIRNPLYRNISYMFQTGNQQSFNDVKTKKNNYKGEKGLIPNFGKKSVDELIEAFFNKKDHEVFNDWFEEFFEITQLKEEFDKEAGYKIYSLKNNNHILLYKFEKF